jgi:catechol 2,3-dioxygenase-like lactoylglutathione lyase family enzyme
MELIISHLIDRFERGTLTRRELVQGLATLSAGAASCEAQPRPAATQGTRIDHVSIQVRDLPRSVAFYQEMFGLSIVSEDKPNEIVRLGLERSVIVSLHHKNPTGIVDHFAIGVRNFSRDTVATTLKERGAEPSDNLDAGFHIVDPEGISVQIMGA